MFLKASSAIFLLAFSLFIYGCAGASPYPAAGSPTGAIPTSTSVPAKTSAPQNATAPTVTPVSSPSGASGNLVRVVVVPEKSQANYRVREQLANVQFPSDAVGATNAITGTLVGKPDGTIVSEESKFVVNLSTLKSDAGQRDDFIKRGVLQTNQYPNATFVPKEAPGIPTTVPPSGEATFKLIGDLTVRNVTKPVTWDTTCKGNGSEGTCTAKTSFQFGYFNLQIPQVARVLSIVDNITLELSIYLTRVK